MLCTKVHQTMLWVRRGGRKAHEIFIPALDVGGGGGRDNGTAIERREIKKDILDISVLQSTPHQGQRYVVAAYLREETRFFFALVVISFPVAFWLDGCQGELYNFLQACSYFLWRGIPTRWAWMCLKGEKGGFGAVLFWKG